MSRCDRCWRTARYDVPIYAVMTDEERRLVTIGRAEPKRWEKWCQRHRDKAFWHGGEYAWLKP